MQFKFNLVICKVNLALFKFSNYSISKIMSCTVYFTIILVVSFIDWTGAQTSTQKPFFNRSKYLCKDDRVSDETLALLKAEDNKCMDNYRAEVKKISGDNDECLEQSDYSNDKVKDKDNKYELAMQCSPEYIQCQYNHRENRTINVYQDNKEFYEKARDTLMVGLYFYQGLHILKNLIV